MNQQAYLDNAELGNRLRTSHLDEPEVRDELTRWATLLGTDAGDREKGEEDIMPAPREAAQAGDAAASTQAAGGASAVGVLDAVGDDTLFDEEDLDDLPDDE